MFKHSALLIAITLGFWANNTYAAAYDSVFPSPTTIGCASDASCAVLTHVRVQTLTYSGTVGSGLYTWNASCPSSPDGAFYIRPTGAASGCFVMDGFAATTVAAVPLTNAHIFVGNASNVATDVAMSGSVNIDNTGATSIPLPSTNVLVGNGSNQAAGVAVTGDVAITNAGVTTVATSQGQAIVTNVASIAALSALSSPSAIAHVNVKGYYSGTTVGGGNFDYSTAGTVDGCTTVAASDGKYWIRQGRAADIDQCGAKSDNSTDNTSFFQAAANLGYCVRVPAEGYGYAIGTASTNGSINMGNGACFKLDAGAQMLFKNVTATSNFNVQGSNIAVEGGYISCATENLNPCWSFPNDGTSHGRIANTYYTNGAGTSGQFLSVNTGSSGSPTTDWRITGNTLDSFNHTILFGFGTSTTMTGGHWRIDHNYILNAVRSAFTVNTPTGSATPAAWSDMIFDHNNITVVNGSTGSGASGSCMEIAAGESITFDGNICNQSYIEAVHIEDYSQNIKITNNIFNNIPLSYNGVSILSSSSTRVPNGIQISGNQFTVVSGSPTNNGILEDVTNGVPYSLQVSGNQFNGFATGARVIGREQFFGNLIDGASVGINVLTAADIKNIHNNQLRNITTHGVAFNSTTQSIIGTTTFDGTLPTDLIAAVTGGSGAVDGLTFSIDLASTPSGSAIPLWATGAATAIGFYTASIYSRGGTYGACRYSSFTQFSNPTSTEPSGSGPASRKTGSYTNCATSITSGGTFNITVTTSNTGPSHAIVVFDGPVFN